VLGIDLGFSAVIVASAFSGELVLGVYPQLGNDHKLHELYKSIQFDEIIPWIENQIKLGKI